MEALVKRKMGWPRNGLAFCSYELKIKPAMEWLERFDPDKEATCLVGIRREESPKRALWPEHTEESPNHGGRSLWAPLVRYDVKMRDELIVRSGFEVLPHRSMECYPCVNACREDIAMLSPVRVDYIENFENSLGVGVRSGKPKTMFRPKKKRGAVGIREVWAWSKDKKFKGSAYELDLPKQCDSGFCGD
jgi:hypothetical protein